MKGAYGAATVSTGIVRYDKRSGLANPVIMANLNNKRQQKSCIGCLIDSPLGVSIGSAVDISSTRSPKDDLDLGPSVTQEVNLN